MMQRSALEDNWARWLGDEPGPVRSEPLLEALDGLHAAEPGRAAAARAVRKTRAALDRARPNALFFDTFPDSPLGPLHIAVSERGVVALSFGRPLSRFLEELQRWTGLTPVHDQSRVARAGRQVQEYLAGERAVFDLPLDLRLLTPFQRQVLQRVAALPRGQIATYGQVAGWLGKPRAARAVGQALARNPIPLVIPCHRVLASDGSLGGYSGGRGLPTKLRLLRMEGAPIDSLGRAPQR